MHTNCEDVFHNRTKRPVMKWPDCPRIKTANCPWSLLKGGVDSSRTLYLTLCFLVERKSNNNTAKDENRNSKNKDNELLFHRNEKIVITIEKENMIILEGKDDLSPDLNQLFLSKFSF